MKRILFLSLVIGLVGCGTSETEKTVENTLKDPDSAKFRNVKGVCGEVNAKNGFGAYGGYKKFINLPEGVLFESNVNQVVFNRSWVGNCGTEKEKEVFFKEECSRIAFITSTMLALRASGSDEKTKKQALELQVKNAKNPEDLNANYGMVDYVFSIPRDKVNKISSFEVEVKNKCISNNLSFYKTW